MTVEPWPRVIALLGALAPLAGAGCWDGAASSSAGASQPRAFDALGPLAQLEGAPLGIEVSDNAQQITLGDGLTLDIAAGAFPGPTTLVVAQTRLELDALGFYVATARGIGLATERSLPSLGARVELLVSDPSRTAVPLFAADGDWTRSEPAGTDPLRLSITHFSENTFAVLLPEPSTSTTPAVVAVPDERARIGAANDMIEALANPWEQAFLGVGERGDPAALCEALKDLLALRSRSWRFAFPSEVLHSGLSTVDLGRFLFTSRSPSEVTDTLRVFWTATLPSQARIRSRVLESTVALGPADLLTIAVEENGGDAAIGVLAAHNFLKELTNEGRDMVRENFGDPFTGQIVVGTKLRGDPARAAAYQTAARDGGGEVASHLQAWRSADRSPSGAYDKLGPLYHVFAAMSAAALMPSIDGGSIAVAGEALMRASGITGDVADPEKGLADHCGADVGRSISFLYDDPPAPVVSADGGAGDSANPPAPGAEPNCGGSPWTTEVCHFAWRQEPVVCKSDGAGSGNWMPYESTGSYLYVVSAVHREGLFQWTGRNGVSAGLDCRGPVLAEFLDCMITLISNRNCVDLAASGPTCNSPQSILSVCGQYTPAIPEGTLNYSEVDALRMSAP